jgi:hypothetical protein
MPEPVVRPVVAAIGAVVNEFVGADRARLDHRAIHGMGTPGRIAARQPDFVRSNVLESQQRGVSSASELSREFQSEALRWPGVNHCGAFVRPEYAVLGALF